MSEHDATTRREAEELNEHLYQAALYQSRKRKQQVRPLLRETSNAALALIARAFTPQKVVPRQLTHDQLNHVEDTLPDPSQISESEMALTLEDVAEFERLPEATRLRLKALLRIPA